MMQDDQTGNAGANEPGVAAHPPPLGPTSSRNWGWVLPLGGAAGLLILGAGEATLHLGVGWRETGLPLLLALPFMLGAFLVWRAAPFEQCGLRSVPEGLMISGRRDSIVLPWSGIAAVTHRPSGLGLGYVTVERSADAADIPPIDPGRPGHPDAPGVIFSVRATGARVEDILGFMAAAARAGGYDLVEAGRGSGRERAALYRLAGPRRWIPEPMTRIDAGSSDPE